MNRLTMQEVIEHCERTAKRIEDNVGFCREWLGAEPRPLESKNYLEHKQTAEWLKELQRYKDLEEAGRLIELPRKVGDTVYGYWIDDGIIMIDELYIMSEMQAIVMKDLWEKKVFPTRKQAQEAAEAKLAELQSLPIVPILHGNIAPSSKEEATERLGLKDKPAELKEDK